jgi:HK97 family phage major capsid protein
MDPVAEIRKALDESFAPVLKGQKDLTQNVEKLSARVDEVGSLKEQLSAALERITVLEKGGIGPGTQLAPGRVIYRVDAYGRPVSIVPESEAPAFLRSGANKMSKPLSITNVLRGLMANTSRVGGMVEHASEEMAFSKRCQKAGYQLTPNHIHFPMGETLFPAGEPLEGDEDYREIRKEASERLTIAFDPGEIGWIAKRYPEFSNRAVGKATGDMMVSDDQLGAYLIPTTYGDRVIDLLRNRLSIMRAGATEIALPPTGNITWIRLTEDPAPSYGDPDTTTDGTSTGPKLAPIRLQAKGLKAWVSIPNDLIRYASPSVELLVRMSLAAKFAVAEDFQFLQGKQSTIAPLGLINYALSAAETPTQGLITKHVAKTAPNSNTLGTFEPEDVAAMIGLYYLANDPDPATGWILRPTHWASIMNKRADAVTAADGKGPFMFWTSRGDASAALPQSLAGYPCYPTAQVTADRVQGTTTTGVFVLFGNFRRVIIGRVGTMELAVSEHIKFFQDKIVIRAVERHDMAMEHEESIVFCDQLDQTK